jgi:hypothetical protein
MTKAIDLTGQRFTRLVAIEPTQSNYSKRIRILWMCICDCGNRVFVPVSSLRNGNTKSCGCLSREITSRLMFKHGQACTPLYKRLHDLKMRYNLSPEQYQQMLFDQGWCCKTCGINESDLKEMSGKGLCIDHDHLTGKTRGLLCDDCNRGLGIFKEQEYVLQNAINYLKMST